MRSTARCLAQLGVPLLRGDGTPWSAPVDHAPRAVIPPERPAGALPLPDPDSDMGPDDAIVLGVGLRGLLPPIAHLDCGNSGTTLRLLSGILAGSGVPDGGDLAEVDVDHARAGFTGDFSRSIRGTNSAKYVSGRS